MTKIRKFIISEKAISSLFVVFVFAVTFYGATHFGLPGIPATLVAPDESTRMLVANFITHFGRLPFGTEASVRLPSWGFSYAMEPYLPSIIAAFFMKLKLFLTHQTFFYSALGASRFSISLTARMVSVLSVTGTTLFSFKIGKELFKKYASQFLFAVLVSLLPQFIYLGTYFNNDAFSVFTTFIIFYAWILGSKYGWTYRRCLLLIIGLSACLLTYYFAYSFILCSVLVFMVTIFRQYRKRYARVIQKGGFVFAGTFLLSGWFFIWNKIKFNDFLGLSTVKHYGEIYGSTYPPLKPSIRPTPAHLGIHFSNFFSSSGHAPYTNWFFPSWQSFVGVFGILYVFLPYRIYEIYNVFFITGILLGGLAIWRLHLLRKHAVVILSLLICAILPILLSMYYSYFVDFQAQGRYFMSLLLPLMLLVTVGFSWLSAILKRYIRLDLEWVIASGYMIVFLIAYFGTMLPQLTQGVIK